MSRRPLQRPVQPIPCRTRPQALIAGSDDDDQLIVAQIVSGKRELFRMLVKRHEKAVYNMGLSFFRNAEDAGDFTQDVFLKTFRSLPGFEGRSRFSTWLYRIAYNTAINAVQRQKEYWSLADEDRGESPDTPERDFLRTAAREGVREAMETLPERFRICMDLYFFYDRSYQEIEMITGYPVNTIKSHMFRAKKLLREKLAGIMEGGIE